MSNSVISTTPAGDGTASAAPADPAARPVWIPQQRPIDEETVTESAMYRFLRDLIDKGQISLDDSLLVVFGGEFDRRVLSKLRFRHVTLSNKAGAVGDQHFDSRAIPHEDSSFDHVIAHAGLHHCSRPHQAVCEMYRVSRKSAMFFEAQDSWMMRYAVKLRLTVDYEWNAILDHGLRRGGVDDTPIPNYVYRWTRREVEKLVRTLDPAHMPCLSFRTEWDISYPRVMRRLRQARLRVLPDWLLAAVCSICVTCANSLFGSQGNVFFARIEKKRIEQPWMKGGLFVAPFEVPCRSGHSAGPERA